MVGRTKALTEEDKNRFHRLREHGCIACKIMGFGWSVPEIHHLTKGFKRLGHEFTLPLCAWHHRAVPPFVTMKKSEARDVLGPSLAMGKRSFQKWFGSEEKLLEQINWWLESEEKDDEPREHGVNVNSLPF